MQIFNSPRLREYHEGKEQLKEIFKDKSKCLIIHYSCESFITNHGRTPRVTSICINSLKTSQTTSFSIHLQAQFESLDFNNLTVEEYDKLELSMLTEFTSFVKEHPTSKWIHWNMRDSNFGFLAINNRLRILGGIPYTIQDDFKFDLPRILQLVYSKGYEVNRPDGRLLNLANRNKLTVDNALTGKQEADAFDAKQYLSLHMSTLRKVDIILALLNQIERDELKIQASKVEQYGLSPKGILFLIRETPWLLILFTALGWLLGKLVDIGIEHYMKS